MVEEHGSPKPGVRIWTDLKDFANFLSSLWSIVGIITVLFPLWSDYLNILPLPSAFLRFASISAFIIGCGSFFYEYIERDSLLTESGKLKKKGNRYGPDGALLAALVFLSLFLFFAKLTVFERPNQQSKRSSYYITGIADPILRPAFIPSKEKYDTGLKGWEIDTYLRTVPEDAVDQTILDVYGRTDVAVTWTILFALYVVTFIMLTSAFAQLAVREYLKQVINSRRIERRQKSKILPSEHV